MLGIHGPMKVKHSSSAAMASDARSNGVHTTYIRWLLQLLLVFLLLSTYVDMHAL